MMMQPKLRMYEGGLVTAEMTSVVYGLRQTQSTAQLATREGAL